NLDDDPRFLYGRKTGKLRDISLRLRFDDPLVSFKKLPETTDQQLCNAIMREVLKFVEDLGIRAKELEVYETITYGTDGTGEGETTGGVGEGLTTGNKTAQAIIAAFGGILGYLIGESNETVTRIVCDKLI
ncbi:MAG: hypothetical protein JZD40_04390, partial [Sulfolobus sp.]|nr:hypothetical protein [Sulfolobus sp.]